MQVGSITKRVCKDAHTGKQIVQFRAYVRRQGYESKSKVCNTQREAREWLREHEAKAALGKVGSGKSFASLVESFVEAPPAKGRKFWSPSALDFWKAEFGVMRIGDVGRGDINAAKAKLQSKRAQRNTPNGIITTQDRLTPATMNRYLASLSSVFNYAVELGLIDVHPMKAGAVRKLTESNARTRVLTDDETERLLAAATRSEWPMLPLLLRMLMTTAARRSEVLNLRWSQVELSQSLAFLPKTKNGQARVLPLVADVREALAEAKKVRPLHSDYVFFDPRDPTKPKTIEKAWRNCRADAGLLKDREDLLDRIYLHSLRHTSITRMVRSGANVAQVAKVSGHKTLAMVARYQHLDVSDALELAQRVLAPVAAK